MACDHQEAPRRNPSPILLCKAKGGHARRRTFKTAWPTVALSKRPTTILTPSPTFMLQRSVACETRTTSTGIQPYIVVCNLHCELCRNVSLSLLEELGLIVCVVQRDPIRTAATADHSQLPYANKDLHGPEYVTSQQLEYWQPLVCSSAMHHYHRGPSEELGPTSVCSRWKLRPECPCGVLKGNMEMPKRISRAPPAHT